jgi:hypothetical protein
VGTTTIGCSVSMAVAVGASVGLLATGSIGVVVMDGIMGASVDVVLVLGASVGFSTGGGMGANVNVVPGDVLGDSVEKGAKVNLTGAAGVPVSSAPWLSSSSSIFLTGDCVVVSVGDTIGVGVRSKTFCSFPDLLDDIDRPLPDLWLPFCFPDFDPFVELLELECPFPLSFFRAIDFLVATIDGGSDSFSFFTVTVVGAGAGTPALVLPKDPCCCGCIVGDGDIGSAFVLVLS